ncbi:MAG: type VII toxin-antitoxin system MntA family adenylyltransferase antitoxin [Actinomycetota bacterium]
MPVSASHVNRRAPIPPNDQALLAELRTLLAKQADVLVAYLFGSRARGTAGPISDIDIAVLLEPGADSWNRSLELLGDLSTLNDSAQVDLVILNDASIDLGYRVLRDGIVLTCKDEKSRIAHFVRTVNEYLDMAPFRRTLAAGLTHRLEEGRFGRP